MKKIIMITLAVMLAFASTPAFAFSVNGYHGPVTMKFSGYTRSQDQSFGGETWGVVKLSGIYYGDQDNELWTPGTTGEDIYGLIWGLTDHNYVLGQTNEVQQVGGNFALFLSTDSNDSDEYLLDNPTTRRVGSTYDSVTNIAGGTPWLTGVFSPGIVSGEAGNGVTTVQQLLNQIAAPASGKGKGYGDVTGGDFANLFNTNSLIDSYLNEHDLLFDFTVAENKNGTPLPAGWHQYINDPVTANVAPEPATMVLFGTGLVGMFGAVIRRKKA